MANFIDRYIDDLQYTVDKYGDAGDKRSLEEIRRYIKEIAPSASANIQSASVLQIANHIEGLVDLCAELLPVDVVEDYKKQIWRLRTLE